MPKAKPHAHDDEIPVEETKPTTAEAKEMFRQRPDLWSVETDEGTLTRDGTLTPNA